MYTTVSDTALAYILTFGPVIAIAAAACICDFARSFKDEPSKIIAEKRAARDRRFRAVRSL